MGNKNPEKEKSPVKLCKECVYIQNKPSLESETCSLCGQSHLKIDRFPQDTWKDESVMDLISFTGLNVKFTLPNGDRITTTLLDYNRCMPIIYGNESKWRNGMNAKKRIKLGWNKEDETEIENFDVWWSFSNRKKT